MLCETDATEPFSDFFKLILEDQLLQYDAITLERLIRLIDVMPRVQELSVNKYESLESKITLTCMVLNRSTSSDWLLKFES